MKYSVYDLAFTFVEMFYTKDIPQQEKKTILYNINTLIITKWTAEEILFNFKRFKANNPDAVMDIKAYFSPLYPKQINILTPNKFYYHNELRITTKAPVIDVDINTGIFTRIVEDYYLEMRASYTVEDLKTYFLSKPCLYQKGVLDIKRIMGIFNWLLKTFDLDLLLFMFDTTNDVLLKSDEYILKNPMDVKNYYAEALQAYNNKKNESKLNTDDIVVTKKRVLFSQDK